MPVILAIDAAWTATQPSGVALIATAEGARPRCLAVAPSYSAFLELARADAAPGTASAHLGSTPDIPALSSPG